jgi:hypothetical protein
LDLPFIGSKDLAMSVHEEIASALELQGPLEEVEQRFENAQLMYSAAQSIRSLCKQVKMYERCLAGGAKFNPDAID